ncbi:MAG: phosphate ABC transporter permease subunit PstC [Chloroflexota bacterium]
MAAIPQTSQPAIAGQQRGDQYFALILRICSLVGVLLLVGLILILFVDSLEVIGKFGIKFLTGSDWNPVAGLEEFGALPYIFGTVVTSIIALLLATPLALGAALFVSEYAPRWLANPVAFLVELLVAIPSVAYGIWGLFVLVPIMRDHVDPFLQNTIGRLPIVGALFPRDGLVIGQDLLTAGVILTIMILPTILSISREIISQVPRLQKEGMLALGATKWEMLSTAILPYARGGIVGAMMLGLARAFGETMAVTLVIGNSSSAITPSLFTPGYTISSAIANQFAEADTSLYFSAVVGLGLILLFVSLVFNFIARLLVKRLTRMPGGGKA